MSNFVFKSIFLIVIFWKDPEMTRSIYLLLAALLCSVILAKEIPKLPSVRRTSDAVIYTIIEEETITIEETIEIFGGTV